MTLLAPFVALLTSVFLLIAGNSLISLVVPIRADLDGFGALTIGLIGSAYFAGMLGGTLATPAIVRRVGHVRAFSAFTAIGVAAVDVMPLSERAVVWFASRGLLGFVFAGIYAVIESWINGKAENTNRGGLYGVYQIVNFAASTLGQLMLRGQDVRGFAPFVVGSLFLTLGIAPLSLTRVAAPEAPRTTRLRLSWLLGLAPISIAAAGVAGATNGVSAALAPVYALKIGIAPGAVPLFTAAIVLGSALGVYPAGRLSDRMDRRTIMAIAMAVGAGFEAALAFTTPHGAPLATLGFLVGLTTFTLYTLGVSIANDRADTQDMVLVSAGLLFVYCAAAIVAPPVASLGMRWFGPWFLYAQNAALHAGLAVYAAAGGLSFRRR